MWNGTTETLKPNPTSTSIAPAHNIGLSSMGESVKNAAMVPRFVVPVAPNIRAMP